LLLTIDRQDGSCTFNSGETRKGEPRHPKGAKSSNSAILNGNLGKHSLSHYFNEKEIKMGRVKDWLMGMEEDATCMSLDEWISKHGEWNKTVYETVNGEEDGRIFYDLFE